MKKEAKPAGEKDKEREAAVLEKEDVPAAPEDETPADEVRGTPAGTDGGNGKNEALGKFRNPEELLKAYGELEREFTRRSQRLAEAEKKLAEAQAPYAPDGKEWKETVDKFFEKFPAAKPFAGRMARELMRHPELRRERGCLGDALMRVLVSEFRTPEQLMSDGQFLKDHVLTSTVVKAAVIEGYLKGLREGQPPAVMRDGGQFGPAPRRNPKSIEEAGDLFLKDNG